MHGRIWIALVVTHCVASFSHVSLSADKLQVVKSEMLYDKALFPKCHASTLAETPTGLVAAYFGGSDEGERDVSIWVSRQEDGKWTAPALAAAGTEDPQQQYPCWNPVLYQVGDGQVKDGPLLLFYKVGPNPKEWWGMLTTSTDAGRTWSKSKRLPDGILGPIKNKPVLLDGSELLCPSSTEHDGWRLHMERTGDWGSTWKKTEPLNEKLLAGKVLSAIQPTILKFGDKLQILCRTGQGKIYESWSSDAGKTWTPLAAASLPNPNSGIDAVNLPDGRALLVYNHTTNDRTPLNVATSSDGKNWQSEVVLETEPGEYSYPAVITTRDGHVHITYTWNRDKIKHVELK